MYKLHITNFNNYKVLSIKIYKSTPYNTNYDTIIETENTTASKNINNTDYTTILHPFFST